MKPILAIALAITTTSPIMAQSSQELNFLSGLSDGRDLRQRGQRLQRGEGLPGFGVCRPDLRAQWAPVQRHSVPVQRERRDAAETAHVALAGVVRGDDFLLITLKAVVQVLQVLCPRHDVLGRIHQIASTHPAAGFRHELHESHRTGA